MALILLNTGRLPVVQDLNAFEQIFHKLLKNSILCIDRNYMKYIEVILVLEDDGFNISIKNILNVSFGVYSNMLNAIPITTTLFGLIYYVPTNYHSLEILDTILFKFEQFKLFLDYGGMFIDDDEFANALDFIAIKINNIILSDGIIGMPILVLPSDINTPSYTLNNFCALLDYTITYLVDIKRYSLYDVLKHIHIYSRLVFYNIAIVLDKFMKLAQLNNELDKILDLIIDDYSQQIGHYIDTKLKIDELINFTNFLIPYLFFNVKSINLILSYIKKQEHRVLLYKIPIILKLFFRCIQDGILKGLVTESEYMEDLQLFIQLGIYEDTRFLRSAILCSIRAPELKMVVMDGLNTMIFPDEQFKSTNLLPIIIESVKSIENMYILEYVFKRFEDSKEFLFEIILENLAKLMIDHLNNTEFFIKIIIKFIYYGFELSRFPYFLDQCFELSTTINIFYKIINNTTIMNSMKNIHFDTFKYCHKNMYSRIANKWNISNTIMINGVSGLLKNILNKINTLLTIEEKPIYTEAEIIALFETNGKSENVKSENKNANANAKKKKKGKKNTKIETPEIKTPKIPKSEIPKSEIPKSEIPESEIPESEIPESEIPEIEITEIEITKIEITEIETPEIETPEIKTSTDEISEKSKKYSDEKLIAFQIKKASKKLKDAISIKTLLSKLVTASILEIYKTDIKFIIYTGGSVGLGTNITLFTDLRDTSHHTGQKTLFKYTSSDLDLCLIIDYIEDNLNALLNILLLKLSPYFKEGCKIIPSGKKSPTMITMVTNNIQSISIDLSICVCNYEHPFDFTNEIFMAHSIYQAYNTCSHPEYRFLFYDTNTRSLSSLHASYALIFNCTIQNKISIDDIELFQGIVIGVKTILIKSGAYGSTIGYLGGSALAVMAMTIILRYNKTINSIEESIRVNFGIKTFCKFYSNRRFWETFGLSIMDGIIDKPQDWQHISMYIDAYGSCLSYNVWKNTMNRTITIFDNIASIDSASIDSTSIDSASIDGASIDSASIDSASGYYYIFTGTFCSKNLSNTLKEIIITLQLGFTTECNIIPMSHSNGFVLVIEQDLNLDYVKAVVSGFNLHFETAIKQHYPYDHCCH
jgi:hypothetical protein